MKNFICAVCDTTKTRTSFFYEINRLKLVNNSLLSSLGEDEVEELYYTKNCT